MRPALRIIGYGLSGLGHLLLVVLVARGARPLAACGFLQLAAVGDWASVVVCVDRAGYEPIVAFGTTFSSVFLTAAGYLTIKHTGSVPSVALWRNGPAEQAVTVIIVSGNMKYTGSMSLGPLGLTQELPQVPAIPTAYAAPGQQSYAVTNLERIHKAILAAFTRDELRQVLRTCMNEDLDALVAEKPFADQIFDLLSWAQRQGRARDLTAHLCNARPDNAELNACIF